MEVEAGAGGGGHLETRQRRGISEESGPEEEGWCGREASVGSRSLRAVPAVSARQAAAEVAQRHERCQRRVAVESTLVEVEWCLVWAVYKSGRAVVAITRLARRRGLDGRVSVSARVRLGW